MRCDGQRTLETVALVSKFTNQNDYHRPKFEQLRVSQNRRVNAAVVHLGTTGVSKNPKQKERVS